MGFVWGSKINHVSCCRHRHKRCLQLVSNNDKKGTILYSTIQFWCREKTKGFASYYKVRLLPGRFLLLLSSNLKDFSVVPTSQITRHPQCGIRNNFGYVRYPAFKGEKFDSKVVFVMAEMMETQSKVEKLMTQGDGKLGRQTTT